jgi:hypothetical protein
VDQIGAAALKPAFDEMNGFGQGVREPYAAVSGWLDSVRVEDLRKKSAEA